MNDNEHGSCRWCGATDGANLFCQGCGRVAENEDGSCQRCGATDGANLFCQECSRVAKYATELLNIDTERLKVYERMYREVPELGPPFDADFLKKRGAVLRVLWERECDAERLEDAERVLRSAKALFETGQNTDGDGFLDAQCHLKAVQALLNQRRGS